MKDVRLDCGLGKCFDSWTKKGYRTRTGPGVDVWRALIVRLIKENTNIESGKFV